MGETYQEHFNNAVDLYYIGLTSNWCQRAKGYLPYICLSSIDCMHWSLNKVKFNISIRKCTTKASDEHKHDTMQPFDTAFGGPQGTRLLKRWPRLPVQLEPPQMIMLFYYTV